jgi:hypothetical protein
MKGTIQMDRIRGVLMVMAACVAFWEGWRLRGTHFALSAVGLGALALALGLWHLLRKPARPRN